MASLDKLINVQTGTKAADLLCREVTAKLYQALDLLEVEYTEPASEKVKDAILQLGYSREDCSAYL